MNEENIILTMDYADGTAGKRELLTVFLATNGNQYAALLPLNEDESVQEDASIELVRVKAYENEDMQEDYLMEEIETDSELKIAMEAFEQLEVRDLAVNQEEDHDGLVTLNFTNEAGESEPWKVVDVFEHNNRKYIALIPLSEMETMEDQIQIYLMRLELTVKEGIEGCEVRTIPSDMEYEEVSRVFETRINEANELNARSYQ